MENVNKKKKKKEFIRHIKGAVDNFIISNWKEIKIIH